MSLKMNPQSGPYGQQPCFTLVSVMKNWAIRRRKKPTGELSTNSLIRPRRLKLPAENFPFCRELDLQSNLQKMDLISGKYWKVRQWNI